MIARHGIALAMILPSFVGYESPAVARGGLPSNDPTWNSEHISSLPGEIRKALIWLCGESGLAAHYFATYSDHSRLVNLDFEHFQCRAQEAFCTQAGCLHQVYGLSGGRYRLLRSYYGPSND
jgi:hypothetical protein